MNLITTTADLAAACERMSRHTFVTVDTEFLRETTYYPLLCVAQIATSDEAIVIDALAQDLNLTPFFELMANEGVLKVFHAARQDIEIVWHQAKLIPRPVTTKAIVAQVNPRFRKLRRSTNGDAWRRSQMINAVRTSAPPMMPPSTRPSVQPWIGCSMTP